MPRAALFCVLALLFAGPVSGQSLTASVTPAATPTRSATGTASATKTGTPSSTVTGSPSLTASGTPTSSLTPTQTRVSPTSTPTRSPSLSVTPTSSLSRGAAPSTTPSGTLTGTASRTGTGTSSASQTGTPTQTPTPSSTASVTPSGTQTASSTGTQTVTPTSTHTLGISGSPTSTLTGSPTATMSRTPRRTNSRSPSNPATRTPSATSSIPPTFQCFVNLPGGGLFATNTILPPGSTAVGGPYPDGTPSYWSFRTNISAMNYNGDGSVIIGPARGSGAAGVKFIMIQVDTLDIVTNGTTLTIDMCDTIPSTSMPISVFLGTSCPALFPNVNQGLDWSSFNAIGAAQGGCSNNPNLPLIQGLQVVTKEASRYLYMLVAVPDWFTFTVEAGEGIHVSINIEPPLPTQTPSQTPSSTPACQNAMPEGFISARTAPALSGTLRMDLSFNTASTFLPSIASTQWPAGQQLPNPSPLVPGQLILIDLGEDAVRPGGWLVVDTCPDSDEYRVDTFFWLDEACPGSPAWGSQASNDNQPAGSFYADDGSLVTIPPHCYVQGNLTIPALATQSSMATIFEPQGQFVFVYVIGKFWDTMFPSLGAGSFPGGVPNGTNPSVMNATARYMLNWRYTLPTPTNTPSITPSRSLSASRTASRTSSHTHPASDSITGTPSSAVTPSWTPTRSSGVTRSITVVASRTPTNSPRPTLSPNCRFGGGYAAMGVGLTGRLMGNTALGDRWAGTDTFSAMRCSASDSSAGADRGINVTFPQASLGGAVHVVQIDLSEEFVPGGTLTIDTCTDPFMDTVIAVGVGCPDLVERFRCMEASDDSFQCPGFQGALVASVSSFISLPRVQQRFFNVLVTAKGGSQGPYTVSWNYFGAPFSPSSAPTTLLSPSSYPTASTTEGVSRSTTPTLTGTPAFLIVSASRTPSKSNSPAPYIPPTPSPTSSQWSCGQVVSGIPLQVSVPGLSGSVVASVNGLRGAIRYGLCDKQDSVTPDDNPSINWQLVNGNRTKQGILPGPQVLVQIDLGVIPPGPNRLRVWTRPVSGYSTVDTMLFVGTSCPTDAIFDNLRCEGASDDIWDPALSADAPIGTQENPYKWSSVSMDVTPANRVIYALVSVARPVPRWTGSFAVFWAVRSTVPSGSLTATPSFGASASTTARPTFIPTPTPSPSIAFDVFQGANTVLVLRAGDGLVYQTGVAMPLFLDEIRTDDPYASGSSPMANPATNAGATVQTIAINTVRNDSTSSVPCTLGSGRLPMNNYNQEGMISTSRDGLAAAFVCYSTGLGYLLSAADAKVIVRLRYDGTLDYSTVLRNAFNGLPNASFPQSVRSVATDTGDRFYIAGIGGGALVQGVWVVNFGDKYGQQVSGALSGQPGFFDVRSLSFYQPPPTVSFDPITRDPIITAAPSRLWASTPVLDSRAIFAAWPGSPGADVGSTTSMAPTPPGFIAYSLSSPGFSPWGFAFTSNASVWVAADHDDRADVYNFVAQGAIWQLASIAGQAPTFKFSSDVAAPSITSVATRLEAGFWALYAASTASVYRYDIAANVSKLILTAMVNTVLHGVALPPWLPSNGDVILATPVPTASNLPSFTVDPSISVQASLSATNTLAPGVSPSAARTPDGTPSWTATASNTLSSTPTPPVVVYDSRNIMVLRSGARPGTSGSGSPAAMALQAFDGLYLDLFSAYGQLQATPIDTVALPGTFEFAMGNGFDISTFFDRIVSATPSPTGDSPDPEWTANFTRTGTVTPTGSATASSSFTPLSSAQLVSRMDAWLRSIGQSRCTLPTLGASTDAHFALASAQGMPSNSVDGKIVLLPCYNAMVGDAFLPTINKTVMLLTADGSIDTSIQLGDTYSEPTDPVTGRTSAVYQAVTFNGSTIFLTGTSARIYGKDTGVRVVAAGGTVSSVIASTIGIVDARGLSMMPLGASGWRLYVSTGAGAGSNERAGIAITSSSVPGFAAWARFPSFASTRTFAVDQATSQVWAADDRAPSQGQLWRWTPIDGRWFNNSFFLTTVTPLQPVFSIVGRRDATFNAFLVYAVTRSALYRFNAGTPSVPAVLMSVAPTGVDFRGVVFPPRNEQWAPRTPSSSITATGSVSGSQTATGSLTATTTATPSKTPSNSPTMSVTPSSSETASITPSSSITASETRTAASTLSSSRTMSRSQSMSMSLSPTANATQSVTASSSETPSSSATATETASSTSTISSTRTSSRTRTANVTQSVTVTPSVTETPTNTASRTSTPSITPTPTLTPLTASNTPSITPTNSETSSRSSSATLTQTPSITASSTNTRSNTATTTMTPSNTPTISPTRTSSRTMSISRSSLATGTSTRTSTMSATNSLPEGATPSGTPTFLPVPAKMVSFVMRVSGIQRNDVWNPDLVFPTVSPAPDPWPMDEENNPIPVPTESGLPIYPYVPSEPLTSFLVDSLRQDSACLSGVGFGDVQLARVYDFNMDRPFYMYADDYPNARTVTPSTCPSAGPARYLKSTSGLFHQLNPAWEAPPDGASTASRADGSDASVPYRGGGRAYAGGYPEVQVRRMAGPENRVLQVTDPIANTISQFHDYTNAGGVDLYIEINIPAPPFNKTLQDFLDRIAENPNEEPEVAIRYADLYAEYKREETLQQAAAERLKAYIDAFVTPLYVTNNPDLVDMYPNLARACVMILRVDMRGVAMVIQGRAVIGSSDSLDGTRQAPMAVAEEDGASNQAAMDAATVGAVAGGSIFGLIALLLCLALCIYLYRRKKVEKAALLVVKAEQKKVEVVGAAAAVKKVARKKRDKKKKATTVINVVNAAVAPPEEEEEEAAEAAHLEDLPMGYGLDRTDNVDIVVMNPMGAQGPGERRRERRQKSRSRRRHGRRRGDYSSEESESEASSEASYDAGIVLGPKRRGADLMEAPRAGHGGSGGGLMMNINSMWSGVQSNMSSLWAQQQAGAYGESPAPAARGAAGHGWFYGAHAPEPELSPRPRRDSVGSAVSAPPPRSPAKAHRDTTVRKRPAQDDDSSGDESVRRMSITSDTVPQQRARADSVASPAPEGAETPRAASPRDKASRRGSLIALSPRAEALLAAAGSRRPSISDVVPLSPRAEALLAAAGSRPASISGPVMASPRAAPPAATVVANPVLASLLAGRQSALQINTVHTHTHTNIVNTVSIGNRPPADMGPLAAAAKAAMLAAKAAPAPAPVTITVIKKNIVKAAPVRMDWSSAVDARKGGAAAPKAGAAPVANPLAAALAKKAAGGQS